MDISKGKKENKYMQGIMPGAMLFFSFGFMLLVYSPIELYFTNKDEFWFDFELLFWPMFFTFLLFLLISSIILFLIFKYSRRLYNVLNVFVFSAFISAYIQGNFLVKNLPPLDGREIEWNQYPAEQIKSRILWVSVIIITVVLVKIIAIDKFYKLVKYVSVFSVLMLTITVISVGIMNNGFASKPNMSVTENNQFEMSDDTNFVILLLDAVDAAAWENIAEEHPEYRKVLRNFTYFSNAMGAYSFTQCSIPYILSGEWFENEESFEDYSKKAYQESALFRNLQNHGYQMNLYEEEVVLNDEDFYKFHNILPNEKGVNSWTSFIRWQIQMTGFKYAPFDLKKICFVNPDAFKMLRIPAEGCELFTSSNRKFYDHILNDNITFTSERQFKFIHISGAHLPFQYDKDVNIIENGSYEGNLEASMTITEAYLEKLKEAGVYDNSVIIIMADHGFNWENMDDTLHRQNPILFIKGINEQHEFHESEIPISWEDLQEAYQELLEGKDSMSVFEWEEGDLRKRRYLYYEYNKEEKMFEYIQSGHAREYDTFRPTGKIYEEEKAHSD